MKKNGLFYCLTAAAAALFFAGSPKALSGNPASLSALAAEESSSSYLVPEMSDLVAQLQETIHQPAFSLHTQATLSLNGFFIRGTYSLNSDIQIRQGENEEDLQMLMVSSSSLDDVVTTSYYKDGLYHKIVNDTETVKEMQAGEVLSLISEITDLVMDTAAQIPSAEIYEEDGATVYSYELGKESAQEYLDQALEQLHMEKLEGAVIKVQSAALLSRVGESGLLTGQELSIEGSVSQSIFTIPADAEVVVTFCAEDPAVPLEFPQVSD